MKFWARGMWFGHAEVKRINKQSDEEDDQDVDLEDDEAARHES